MPNLNVAVIANLLARWSAFAEAGSICRKADSLFVLQMYSNPRGAIAWMTFIMSWSSYARISTSS